MNWGGASQTCGSNTMTLRIGATITTSRTSGKSLSNSIELFLGFNDKINVILS